jgi:SAM-dependent methyltransferase
MDMNDITGNPHPRGPAEVYDEQFVPALFQQWGAIVAEVAGIRPGQSVLDVACGTGVLALAAAERAGPSGLIVGLDLSDDMLAVAKRKSTAIAWRKGRAEALPFPDENFDAVVSQFGFMFFENKPAALREMMRTLRPAGRLAIAVWDSLDRSPGYAVLSELLQRMFGEKVANAFRAPFVLGDPEVLRSVFAQAGVAGVDIRRHKGTVRFPSIRALVATERACVWTLGGLLDDAQFERLAEEADDVLKPFTAGDAVVFEMPALIASTEKNLMRPAAC